MEIETLGNDERHIHHENGNGALIKQSKTGVKPGDAIWVKLCGSSWWPAQIVDEQAVSDSVKPRKGKSDEVLVRLYGTYNYSYVDPLTSNMEFNNVLERHKGSHKDIIQKALKQEFSENHCGRSKAQGSKSKGQRKREKGSVDKDEAVPRKRASEMQDGEKKKGASPQESAGSARRFKVMQGLGLTAPSGSPFHRNEQPLYIVH